MREVGHARVSLSFKNTSTGQHQLQKPLARTMSQALPTRETFDEGVKWNCRVKHFSRSSDEPPYVRDTPEAPPSDDALVYACIRRLAGPGRKKSGAQATSSRSHFPVEWVVLDMHRLLPPNQCAGPGHAAWAGRLQHLQELFASHSATLKHLMGTLLTLAGGSSPAELRRATGYLASRPGGAEAFWEAAQAVHWEDLDAAAAGRLAAAAWEAHAGQQQQQGGASQVAESSARTSAALLFLSATVQLSQLAEVGNPTLQQGALERICALSRTELQQWRDSMPVPRGLVPAMAVVVEVRPPCPHGP